MRDGERGRVWKTQRVRVEDREREKEIYMDKQGAEKDGRGDRERVKHKVWGRERGR